MSYKTILVHVDDSAHVAARIRVAATIAIAQEAHLIGATSTGVSRFIEEAVASNPYSPVITPYLDTLRQRASARLEKFDEQVRRIGVHSFERRLIDDEVSGSISQQARYSDLVVVGQSDPGEPSATEGNDFPEFVVLHSGCPVLVVPYTGEFNNFGEKVLIAWDGGLEAKRAVHNAIPLLQRAALVEVAVFNPVERPNVHGTQPGADIALYLTRHGIAVNVRESIVPHADIGAALLSHVADIDAGMLVMGCFGHSRLREILLGGVSRTVLSSMTVPVFMSH